MDRLSVEWDLLDYLSALEQASTEQNGYEGHLSTARRLLARWQGGESEDRLRDAIRIELFAYLADAPPGRHAEGVGAAFGALCRTARVP